MDQSTECSHPPQDSCVRTFLQAPLLALAVALLTAQIPVQNTCVCHLGCLNLEVTFTASGVTWGCFCALLFFTSCSFKKKSEKII